ncbi:hypothetical protein EVAR_96460_1 [Eumeta japonica]|uniref:Uncharacterized protein n=1 Tax=Eumeta variegata TaxID=151549 RepID=A0A4C1VW33_EUMVA|nr:hypothetical protein EVAR_96460_1 [Eumeta japonica]
MSRLGTRECRVRRCGRRFFLVVATFPITNDAVDASEGMDFDRLIGRVGNYPGAELRVSPHRRVYDTSHVLWYDNRTLFGRSKRKRACEPQKNRWSPPPMDTRNHRGVTGALPSTRVAIAYPMHREWAVEGGRRTR